MKKTMKYKQILESSRQLLKCKQINFSANKQVHKF